MKQTMTVREVAKLIGVSPQTIRVGLQQGVFHCGQAVKSRFEGSVVL